MTRNITTIIFDFDYTIADSSAGIIECINFALIGLGLPVQSSRRIRSTIGLSLPDTLKKLIGPQSSEIITEFRRLFVQRADEVMVDQTRVYPAVPDLVACLRERGMHLGIVSTKFRRRIQTVLRREGLLDSFSVIVGAEDVTRHKPDPDGLVLALERLDVSPPAALYVGDSVTDAETADNAEVSFVAVLSGVTPATAFTDYPVERIITDLTELAAIF